LAAIVFSGPVNLTNTLPPGPSMIAPRSRYPPLLGPDAIGPPSPEYAPDVSIVVTVSAWIMRVATFAAAGFPSLPVN